MTAMKREEQKNVGKREEEERRMSNSR